MNTNMSRLEKVFVYGTLKRGEPNHGWIQNTTKGISKYLCRAETVEKYPLIIGSRYNIPFLLDAPGRGHNVRGELYEVDEPMLKHLDVLEDHPIFYVRELREVKLVNMDLPEKTEKEESKNSSQSEKSTIFSWIYLIKNFRSELLKEPTLQEYSSAGDHGKPYAEREEDDVTLNDL